MSHPGCLVNKLSFHFELPSSMSSASSGYITFFSQSHPLFAMGTQCSFHCLSIRSSLNLIGMCTQNITVLIQALVLGLESAIPSKHPCLQSPHLSLFYGQINPLILCDKNIFLLQNLLVSLTTGELQSRFSNKAVMVVNNLSQPFDQPYLFYSISMNSLCHPKLI